MFIRSEGSMIHTSIFDKSQLKRYPPPTFLHEHVLLSSMKWCAFILPISTMVWISSGFLVSFSPPLFTSSLTPGVIFVCWFRLLFCHSDSRGLQARCKDKVPTRLSLATRDSESFEGITDSKMSESRLATPSTGDRPSLRASGLPLPIGTSHDNAKLRGILPEQRRSMVPKHRP